MRLKFVDNSLKMKITIKEKNANPLLGRTEVSGELDYEGATPSNAQLAEQLAKEFNADVSLVVVKYIYTKFSQQMADFLAFVYSNREAKDKVERVTKHMKKEAEEAGKKAAEAKKAEKAAEEKPAESEEKKEEASAEEKPEEPKEEEKKEETEEKPVEEEEKKEDIPTAEDLIKETQEKFAGEDREKEEKKEDEDEKEGEQ